MDLHWANISLMMKGRTVLSGVSGRMVAGTTTVILGANGAGKTSLLSCLAGLRVPDAGVVICGDRPVATMPAMDRARCIGLLPQQGDIHWDVHVRALVALGRLPHHGRWARSAADDAAIDAALAATSCTDLADRKAQRLSGGEQARVLLARVLAGEPDWILADEPLANLDPAHQMDAIACLRRAAARGAGVAMVLHDLTLAARIADQVILLKNGAIIAHGPPAMVLTTDNLATAYGVRVHISHDDAGAPIITPIARIGDGSGGTVSGGTV
ncbi:MAG: ABC transporter ATP-binding protein [Sphingopyxis sp.]